MILNPLDNELQTLTDFLKIKTPKAWLLFAAKNIPLLLLDHAHCERKAAATAIHLMSKYPEKKELVEIMSPLAREELLHFENYLALARLYGGHVNDRIDFFLSIENHTSSRKRTRSSAFTAEFLALPYRIEGLDLKLKSK